MKNSKSSENYKKNCEKKINLKKKILKKKFDFTKKNLWKKKLLALRADKKCYRPAGPIKSVIGPEIFHEKNFLFNFLDFLRETDVFLCIHEKNNKY